MIPIPIRDENPVSRTPYVTLALIGINLLVFVYQFMLDQRGEAFFIYEYGVVPAWLTGYASQGPPADWLPRPFTLITYSFLHGGFLHFAGNMLYLWIFGNNIEDVLGPVRFFIFFVIGGVIAALSQIITEASSAVPMVGASGSVAAVLGAYLVLFPRAKVLVLWWLFIVVLPMRIPAIVLLGLWFFMQVISIGGDGVAFVAHIGGFVAGMFLIKLFLPRLSPYHGRRKA